MKHKRPPGTTAVDEHLWRRQHNTIERIADQITDSAGDIGNPYRAIGLLTALENRGAITPAMRQAGERFHELFILAHHETLHAADMGRVGGCGSTPAYHGSQAAKDAIEGALKALGGRHSPAGCCAWLVLGCEYSLRRFAIQEGWMGRPLRVEVATGILIGMLGVLGRHDFP